MRHLLAQPGVAVDATDSLSQTALMLAAARTVSLGCVANKARTPVCKAVKPSGPRSFGAQSSRRSVQPARLSRRSIVTKAGILDSVLGCAQGPLCIPAQT